MSPCTLHVLGICPCKPDLKTRAAHAFCIGLRSYCTFRSRSDPLCGCNFDDIPHIARHMQRGTHHRCSLLCSFRTMRRTKFRIVRTWCCNRLCTVDRRLGTEQGRRFAGIQNRTQTSPLCAHNPPWFEWSGRKHSRLSAPTPHAGLSTLSAQRQPTQALYVTFQRRVSPTPPFRRPLHLRERKQPSCSRQLSSARQTDCSRHAGTEHTLPKRERRLILHTARREASWRGTLSRAALLVQRSCVSTTYITQP